MHPALSVIFFTTASGAGYGLLLIWSLAGAFGLLPADRWTGALGLGASLTLITTGLLASTLHLGHPERAWRALSQFRSSWLSREGVAAVATYLPALILAGIWVLAGQVPVLPALLAAAGAAATIACTGQIYATLKPIARWHHPLTTPIYLAMALATGAVLAAAITTLLGLPARWPGILALLALALAWTLKAIWWRQTDAAPLASTIASATGLGSIGRVRPMEPPHTSANYLLNEMAYVVARRHAARLRRLAPVLGGVVPALAIVLGWPAPSWAAAMLALGGVGALAIGVVIERWLFFAEAKHTVTLYYSAAA